MTRYTHLDLSILTCIDGPPNNLCCISTQTVRLHERGSHSVNHGRRAGEQERETCYILHPWLNWRFQDEYGILARPRTQKIGNPPRSTSLCPEHRARHLSAAAERGKSKKRKKKPGNARRLHRRLRIALSRFWSQRLHHFPSIWEYGYGVQATSARSVLKK